MRFHSTPASILNGEITKLAIIECVIAVAVYVGIGVYFHTFRHYTLAVALAPLMLFRTDKSVRWAIDQYSRVLAALLDIPIEKHPFMIRILWLVIGTTSCCHYRRRNKDGCDDILYTDDTDLYA